MIPSRKTEDRAISAIQSIVDLHPTMEARINKCDKELCWDGYLRIYHNNNSLSDKKNYDDDVPIQVKGHATKDTYRDKDRIKEGVDVDDLENYFKTRGCLYFVVYTSEMGNESTVFYSSLYPSKIKEILDNKENKQKESKTISIPFIKLDKDGDHLYQIAKQFSLESNKQGTGRGQIVPNSIPFKDIRMASKLSATFFGKNPSQILERIHTGDIVFYGKKGDMEYPVQMFNVTTSFSQIIEQPITVNGVKYYSSYSLKIVADSPNAKEYKKELPTIIKLSENLSIKAVCGTFQFHFSPTTDLMQIGNDSRFLVALTKSPEVVIGDKKLKIGDTDAKSLFVDQLVLFAKLGSILEEINCPINVPYPELKEDDIACLSQLIQIKDGGMKGDWQSEFVSYNWWFRDKCCPIIVFRNSEGAVSITNLISNPRFRAFVFDDKMKLHSFVPNYLFLNQSVLSKLMFYDYESMFDQVEKSTFNEYTCGRLNELALHLISAYDICQDLKLLSIAKLILKHLLEFSPRDVTFYVNMLQIEYRIKGTLSDTQKKKLLKIEKRNVGDNESFFSVFCFCRDVLLNNKDNASRMLTNLQQDERIRIEDFPIMNLYRDLT